MAKETPAGRVKKALKPLGYPISRVYHEGKEDTYFTFQMAGASPAEFGDDEYERLLYSFAVILTTKHDYTELLLQAVRRLRDEGFTITGIEAETLDIETGLFYVPVMIKELED